MPGKFPGCSDNAWPEIFTLPAMPSPSTMKNPGQLPHDVIRRYFEDGYVIVEDFFTPEELNPCKTAIADVVDDVANMLFKKGKIRDLYNDFGIHERLVRMNEDFPGANILVIKQGRVPKAFQKLWSNERLLNVVEQLIGPNIAGNPVWNLRAKIPNDEDTTVPWHQDNGYMDKDTYNMHIPTAWIPFIDTNSENGCMEFIEGGHRRGKVATHQCCHGGTWYVMLEEEEMEKTLVDLRWQRLDSPSGLWGLKEKVAMRSSENPNMDIDWETFDSVDRSVKQKEAMFGNIEGDEDPDLDTTITGPWMKK